MSDKIIPAELATHHDRAVRAGHGQPGPPAELVRPDLQLIDAESYLGAAALVLVVIRRSRSPGPRGRCCPAAPGRPGRRGRGLDRRDLRRRPAAVAATAGVVPVLRQLRRAGPQRARLPARCPGRGRLRGPGPPADRERVAGDSPRTAVQRWLARAPGCPGTAGWRPTAPAGRPPGLRGGGLGVLAVGGVAALPHRPRGRPGGRCQASRRSRDRPVLPQRPSRGRSGDPGASRPDCAAWLWWIPASAAGRRRWLRRAAAGLLPLLIAGQALAWVQSYYPRTDRDNFYPTNPTQTVPRRHTSATTGTTAPTGRSSAAST